MANGARFIAICCYGRLKILGRKKRREKRFLFEKVILLGNCRILCTRKIDYLTVFYLGKGPCFPPSTLS
jgi:hypothetical protein